MIPGRNRLHLPHLWSCVRDPPEKGPSEIPDACLGQLSPLALPCCRESLHTAASKAPAPSCRYQSRHQQHGSQDPEGISQLHGLGKFFVFSTLFSISV